MYSPSIILLLFLLVWSASILSVAWTTPPDVFLYANPSHRRSVGLQLAATSLILTRDCIEATKTSEWRNPQSRRMFSCWRTWTSRLPGGEGWRGGSLTGRSPSLNQLNRSFHFTYDVKKSCLVSWTLSMFRCILMADASFCNYWTVLIIKIKCIQTNNSQEFCWFTLDFMEEETKTVSVYFWRDGEVESSLSSPSSCRRRRRLLFLNRSRTCLARPRGPNGFVLIVLSGDSVDIAGYASQPPGG